MEQNLNVENVETKEVEETQEESVKVEDTEEVKIDEINEEKTETVEKNSAKKDQARKDFYIKKRIEKKAERDLLEEGRIKGIVEAYNNENPFTNEKIEDQADIEELLTMLELKAQGKDPLNDYRAFIKEKQRNTTSKQQQNVANKQEVKKSFEEQVVDFRKENPDIDIAKLTEDEDFTLLLDNLSDEMELSNIFKLHQKISKTLSDRVNDRVNRAKSKLNSSVGSLSSQGDSPEPVNFSKMNKKEFEKYKEDIRAGRRVINQ